MMSAPIARERARWNMRQTKMLPGPFHPSGARNHRTIDPMQVMSRIPVLIMDLAPIAVPDRTMAPAPGMTAMAINLQSTHNPII